MLQADTGMLLRGLKDALAERVAPVLSDKAATDQLRAAMHMIERLSRVWDLAPRLLREDNKDIAATLERLNLDGAGASADAMPVQSGFNDPLLEEEARRNRELRLQVEVAMQRIVALPVERQEECQIELQCLIERMAQRDLVLAGDAAASSLDAIG